MHNFDFHSARSITDGLDFLSERSESCSVIAGGTDLIPELRKGSIRPASILNILEIDELCGISEVENRIHIGPITTYAEVIASDLMKREFPLLVNVAMAVGSPQIRNRGTIGGNIATASPAADMLPAVLAHDGILQIRSKRNGIRTVALADFLKAPYQTGLNADEMITGIDIEKMPRDTRFGFEKLGRRNTLTRARMNMSILIRANADGVLSELRIVPGAVMPVAQRIKAAEEILLGEKPTPELLNIAADRLTEDILKITGVRWSTEYKMPVIRNIFKRLFWSTYKS